MSFLFFLSFLLLCMYLVWLFLLLWFLSLFLLFLSLCFFFSPAPPSALEQENNGINNISFCLPFGYPCENVPSQNHCLFFSLVDFFHPQNMFLFHVLGLSFEGVRDSLLLLICFCFFVFGVWHTTFFRSNLSLVLAFFGFVVFFVRALFLYFCLCGVFIWVLVSCQFLSWSWDCLSLIALSWCCFFYFVSWLLACVCGFSGCLFAGNPLGGSYGYGQPGGVNIFFGFSHHRGVWVKTATALGRSVFSKLLSFQKPASKRWKRTPVFNFVAGNAIK